MRILTLILIGVLHATAYVIGIDFGSEYYKLSVITTSSKLEIVENDHSKRKTQSGVAFSTNGRQFGQDMFKATTRIPKSTFGYLRNLVGVAYNDTRTMQRFETDLLPYNFTLNEERGSIDLGVDGLSRSSEELMAMVLENAKKQAQKFVGQEIKDCVITVPASWSRGQRMALIVSAAIAQLNVLHVLHENTAAAIMYSLGRMDNVTDHVALFYNLGSSNLQVSIAKYDIHPGEKGEEDIENIEMLAHVTNPYFGGRTIDTQLARLLAFTFSQQQQIEDLDVLMKNPKTLAKLMKAANHAKSILSASKSAKVHIENLHNGIDFEHEVERHMFDLMWHNYYDNITDPIQEALDLAKMNIEDIHSVEIIGGVVRVPKVQDLIKAFTGVEELGWHLNADEAMAHGAALYAANFSTQIEMGKPLWLQDVSGYDILATMHNESVEKNMTTIFPSGTPLGNGNIIPWKHAEDFFLTIYANQSGIIEPMVEFEITGITELVEEFPDVQDLKTYMIVYIDLNGFPGLFQAASYYNRTTMPDEVLVEDEGVAIADEETDQETEAEEEPTETEKEHAETEKEPTEPEEEPTKTVPDEQDEEITEEKQEQDMAEKPEEPLLTHHTKQLEVKQNQLDYPRFVNEAEMKKIHENLAVLTQQDTDRKQRLKLRNELESYIYYVKDKLEDETFVDVTSQEQRDKIQKQVDETVEWFDTESDAKNEDLRSHKKNLEKMLKKAIEREKDNERMNETRNIFLFTH